MASVGSASSSKSSAPSSSGGSKGVSAGNANAANKPADSGGSSKVADAGPVKSDGAVLSGEATRGVGAEDKVAAAKAQSFAAAFEAEPGKDPKLSAEDQARVDEYKNARELVDKAKATGYAPESVTPELIDAGNLIAETQGAYDESLEGVKKARLDMNETSTRRNDLLGNEGKLMKDGELARLTEYADGKVAEDQTKLETATKDYLDTVADPVFQEHLKGMKPDEQAAFFGDIAKQLPTSEVGREWLGKFTDGLAAVGAGQDTDSAEAKLAAELRGKLTGDQLKDFDKNMGSIMGLDLVARPDGGPERLAEVGKTLGVPQSEIDMMLGKTEAKPDQLGDFSAAAASSAAFYQPIADEIRDPAAKQMAGGLGNVKNAAKGVDTAAELGEGLLKKAGASTDWMKGLANLGLGIGENRKILGMTADGLATLRRGAQFVGKNVGHAADVFSVISIAQETMQGNYKAAAYDGMALAGGLMAGATSAPVAAAGYTLIGASMLLPALERSVANQDFVDEGVAYALGDAQTTSLRGSAITYAPSYGARIIEALTPEGMSTADYFAQKTADFGYGTADLDTEFWAQTQAEYNKAENARIMAEADAKFAAVAGN